MRKKKKKKEKGGRGMGDHAFVATSRAGSWTRAHTYFGLFPGANNKKHIDNLLAALRVIGC